MTMPANQRTREISSIFSYRNFHSETFTRSQDLLQFYHKEPQLIVLVNSTGWVSKSNIEQFHSIFSDPLPAPLEVDSFLFDTGVLRLSPALTFSCDLDRDTMLFELTGESPYDDVLVYGETVKEAVSVLREEILPILWQDCVSDETVKLSQRAQEMKRDLEKRVQM